MGQLNDKIRALENRIQELETKIKDFSENTEERPLKPYSKVGVFNTYAGIHPSGAKTGLGQVSGGGVLWHDGELVIPPYGQPPGKPIKSYNEHTHSKFAGGALDINVLEIIEYDLGSDEDPDQASWSIYNPHSRAYWRDTPPIKKSSYVDDNGVTVDVEKVGKIDLDFNPKTNKWEAIIDVKTTRLVERDTDGNIVTDDKGNPKSSTLWNEDQTKTSVVWDKNAKVWRFYGVYAEEPEDTGEGASPGEDV